MQRKQSREAEGSDASRFFYIKREQDHHSRYISSYK